VILIPSPNVAEDHQTRNAKALSDKEAAVLITDNQALKSLVDEAIKLVSDKRKRDLLSKNIQIMADRDADVRIAVEVLKLAGK
jgi:UDP-N-acetylglucosamine--N-acetylmuramyl-(pentapeptide) pyrophosphoryl-undecaprenol N-acetylglucosamine transferase